ncbi:MAG: 4-alpha-glucanotransferase [Gemmiger sp.]
MQRSSGILMPISALPGSQGIGTLGKPAHKFVDFLVRSGQTVWQILPVGPTGFGDSPYQSCSAFAGNPYFIDLDLLAADGLLQRRDYSFIQWGKDVEHVDYSALYEKRFAVLRKAYAAFLKRRPVPGYDTPYPDDWYSFRFRADNWLDDYCLYMALKQANQMKSWQEWPRELCLRDPGALENFRAENEEEIGFWAFVQYEFDRQWRALKSYANSKGIRIMGDIPIYVSADSVDAWAGGQLFETDAEGHALRVAGCPPDAFSADGQLWGNPLYNWPYHRQTGYAWWISRIYRALSLYDILRIDHFRGFDTYWAIPAGAPNARTGTWEQGPGMELFRALQAEMGTLPIVAEDLGELFDSVRKLLKDSGFPGMKVMQFAFDGGDSEYLPHNYPHNCVCYPGTHDNETLQGWLNNPEHSRARKAAVEYLALTEREGERMGILRAALASTADLTIIPMGDWLGVGNEGRINTPGRPDGNWQWRARESDFTAALARQIRTMTARYFRAPAAPLPAAKPAPAKKAKAAAAPKAK